MKMSENEINEIEKIKLEWFNVKNPLFNKTPLEFVHEIDPEYDISNLRMIQTSPEEQEFYD
jgi:translation initiation factor 2B subunit (eIF-2B alpha/beta/delta family)